MHVAVSCLWCYYIKQPIDDQETSLSQNRSRAFHAGSKTKKKSITSSMVRWCVTCTGPIIHRASKYDHNTPLPEALLPHTDRATRCVSQNLANCCLSAKFHYTDRTRPDKVRGLVGDPRGPTRWPSARLLTTPINWRLAVVKFLSPKFRNESRSRNPDHAHLGKSYSSKD